MSLASDFSTCLRISSRAPSRLTICCGSGIVILVCTLAAASVGPLSAGAALGGGLVVMGRPRGPAATFRSGCRLGLPWYPASGRPARPVRGRKQATGPLPTSAPEGLLIAGEPVRRPVHPDDLSGRRVAGQPQ